MIITNHRRVLLHVAVDLAIEAAKCDFTQAKLANREDHVVKAEVLIKEYEKLKGVILNYE